MMHMRFAFIVVVLFLGLGREAAAIDATTWRTLSPESQRGYVNGVIDTWINLQKLHENEAGQKQAKPVRVSGTISIFLDVANCIERRKFNYDQINVSVAKYVEARTDRRKYSMAAVTWNAVTEMCKK